MKSFGLKRHQSSSSASFCCKAGTCVDISLLTDTGLVFSERLLTMLRLRHLSRKP